MKLRMLNGAHSMLAYAGFLSGHTYVRDVMRDPALAALVRRHLRAASLTLEPLPGIDFETYAADLAARFENPDLAHETYQIAMDGTEKMPQRIFAPAADALEAGQPTRPFAFATAAWLRYCRGRTDDGESYDLRDPRSEEIAAAVRGASNAGALVSAIAGLPNLFPDRLRASDGFLKEVADSLETMSTGRFRDVIESEAGRS